MKTKRKISLLIEFAILFVAFPLSVVLGLVSVESRWLIWTITAIYLLTIIIAHKPDSVTLGFSSLSFRRLSGIMIVEVAILMAFYLLFVFHCIDRQLLFRLIIVLFLYPLLSVPAQEFFFRSFFFFRYGQIFEARLLIATNALSFAIYHMIFGSWSAIIASLIAGFALSFLYHKYRNFFICWIIHTVFGSLVFLMGWADRFTTLLVFSN